MSPGNEQTEYFGSKSADREGSRNYGAIRNPAVDKIIQHILYTKDRDELVAATKALDRVLLWNHYVVPGWGLRAERVARWDRFSHPDPLPTYSHGFPTIWWWDADKAKKTGGTQ
jgi:microcin C transport system substrate-binding protein